MPDINDRWLCLRDHIVIELSSKTNYINVEEVTTEYGSQIITYLHSWRPVFKIYSTCYQISYVNYIVFVSAQSQHLSGT